MILKNCLFPTSHTFSKLYSLISKSVLSGTPSLTSRWNYVLGYDVSEKLWESILSFRSFFPTCRTFNENSLETIHQLYVTLNTIAKTYNSCLAACWYWWWSDGPFWITSVVVWTQAHWKGMLGGEHTLCPQNASSPEATVLMAGGHFIRGSTSVLITPAIQIAGEGKVWCKCATFLLQSFSSLEWPWTTCQMYVFVRAFLRMPEATGEPVWKGHQTSATVILCQWT